MARRVARGEIWLLHRPAPDKRRPVVVISRDSLLQVLHTATVVPITSTLRGSPTEVLLDAQEGLKGPSCANLVNVLTVRQDELRQFVGSLSPARLKEVCRALNLATGCDE